MVKKYLMFSLEDGKTEKLAEVLGNKTSRKILSLLAEGELSESEISKKLDIPLNTVGYNIKKLKEVGMIKEKKHFFSVRGKRVPIYSVLNKDIVISPKEPKSKFRESFLVISLSAIFTAFILWYEKIKVPVEEAVFSARNQAPLLLEKAGDGAVATSESSVFSGGFGTVGWFLLGIWILILFIVIWMNIKSNKDVRR